MKYFVIFLLWFLFVGFGYYLDEWQGFIISFILFAVLYEGFSVGIKAAWKLVIDISVMCTLMMVGVVIHSFSVLLFPNIDKLILAFFIFISGLHLFNKLTKVPKNCSCKKN